MLLETTPAEPAQAADPSTKPRQRSALTDLALKALKPADKPFKVTDGDGMYVLVSPTGVKSFRLDYRLAGRRETLTVGRYDADAPNRKPAELAALDYGMTVSLKDARALRDRASRQVEAGESPSKAKVLKRTTEADAPTFGTWVSKYFAFKADPKSGEERLADSTLALRKSVYRRLLEQPLAKKRLEDIKAPQLATLLDNVKEKNGPGPAVHARELVLLVYRYAIGKGVEVTNPAETIQRRTIATFKARERNLDRHEVKRFFDALQTTPTLPTLRLALRFMLLTMVRKGEFIGATWDEIDWDRSTWTISAARMKAGREHVVPLSDQALDILTTLQACHPSSAYLHPGRYDSDLPISDATLNRVIDATVARINADLPSDVEPFETFCVHDLRRTASTRLNEALFAKPLIELSLAHSNKDQVEAAYNHAKHVAPRRALLQGWADMIDCWMRSESAREVIVATKVKIDAAAHDDTEIDL